MMFISQAVHPGMVVTMVTIIAMVMAASPVVVEAVGIMVVIAPVMGVAVMAMMIVEQRIVMMKPLVEMMRDKRIADQRGIVAKGQGVLIGFGRLISQPKAVDSSAVIGRKAVSVFFAGGKNRKDHNNNNQIFHAVNFYG